MLVSPIYSTVKKRCQSQILLCADQGQPQKLRISQIISQHSNHPVSKEYIQHMPERRRLTNEEKEEALTMLVEGRGKNMAVKNFIRKKTGKAVTCRDLSNLK